MNRLASALQVAGLVGLTVGAALFAVPLGFVVGGLGLLVLGVALEPSSRAGE